MFNDTDYNIRSNFEYEFKIDLLASSSYKYMNMFVQLNTMNIQRAQLYSWPKYHQSGISMKTTHIFFILWAGFHWFFDDFSGIHGYFGRKNWKPWVVFMKPDKKINWKLSGATLGPRASAPALGPSAAPESFQFIFLSGFMKSPKVSIFLPKNIRETNETIKKINETRSEKKMRGFYL